MDVDSTRVVSEEDAARSRAAEALASAMKARPSGALSPSVGRSGSHEDNHDGSDSEPPPGVAGSGGDKAGKRARSRGSASVSRSRSRSSGRGRSGRRRSRSASPTSPRRSGSRSGRRRHGRRRDSRSRSRSPARRRSRSRSYGRRSRSRRRRSPSRSRSPRRYRGRGRRTHRSRSPSHSRPRRGRRSSSRRRYRSHSRSRSRDRHRGRSRRRGRSPSGSASRSPSGSRARQSVAEVLRQQQAIRSRWSAAPASAGLAAAAPAAAGAPGADVAALAARAHAVTQTFGAVPAAPAAAAAEPKTMREIYIGNLPHGSNAVMVQNALNQAMVQRGLSTSPGLPCVGCWMSGEQRFCFAEFRSAQEATNCLALNGLPFNGVQLRVGRPKGYTGPVGVPSVPVMGGAGIGLGAGLAAAGAVGGDASVTAAMRFGGASIPAPTGDLSNTKLRVFNLPAALGEAEVRQVLAPFGEIKSVNLHAQPGLPLSVTDVEYAEPAAAAAAAEGLRQIQIDVNAGKLVVHFMPGEPAADGKEAAGAGEASGSQRGAGGSTGEDGPKTAESAGDGAAGTADEPTGQPLEDWKTQDPTTVVELSNMITLDDLKDDEEYEDLLADIKEECGKSGTVLEVQIPRPAPDGAEVPGVGRIFVKVADTASASAVAGALSGRFFAGRIVSVKFFDPAAYEAGNF